MTAEECWTSFSEKDRADLRTLDRADGGPIVSIDPLAGMDYAVTDPSIVDHEFPPEHFISQGSVVHVRG